MITYDGQHSIRDKEKLSAWNKGNDFISNIASEVVEDRYCLDFYYGCKEARKYFIQLILKFRLFSLVNFSGFKDMQVRWKISKKAAHKAIVFIDSISPMPEYWTGPLHLYREGRFLLKDIRTGSCLNGQKTSYDFDDSYGHKTSISNFRLNYRNKVSIAIWLVFPFEKPNNEFIEYATYLNQAAPFKFSENHWRSWSYSKSNNLKCSKLDMNLTSKSSSPAKNAGLDRP